MPATFVNQGCLMTAPRLDFVVCTSPAGLHRMAYWEWGDPENDRVLVCVHGLTRTGRDFDTLARQLARDWRVVCPDVVGRGASDWLANPACYTIPQYAADMVTLLARLNVTTSTTLAWLGTSMGGLIGLAVGGGLMVLAANPSKTLAEHSARSTPRFARLILNDVGPRLAPDALLRIGTYLAAPVAFPSFDAAVQYVKTTSAGFGPHSDAQWAALTRHVFIERDNPGDGPGGKTWVKHYDLRLALAYADPTVPIAGEPLLWQAWRVLDCPALILRGAQSDLLTPDTVRDMLATQPQARAHEFPGVGHAPTLMSDEQCRVVREFLDEK